MDIATIVGVVFGVCIMLIGLGPDLHGLFQVGAFLIVAGGGISFILVSCPLQEVVGLVGVVWRTIIVRVPVPIELIVRIVGFAETARREGILALEQELGPGDDPFLSTGVRLAVDGTEPDLIMDILETELHAIEGRHALGQRAVCALGHGCVLFGGVGALLLLALNRGGGTGGQFLVSWAALPLGYGLAVLALTEALARKLHGYGEKEVLAKRVIIEGVMAIQAGDNPRIVEHKLAVFLGPRLRPSASRQGEEPAPLPPPLPDDSGAQELASYVSRNGEHVLAVVERTIRQGGYPPAEEAEGLERVEQVRSGSLSLMLLLARLDRKVRDQVLQALDNPPPIAVAAEAADLDFEDIELLTDIDIQALLRQVDQRDLVVAMKGARRSLVEKVAGNLSAHVRRFVLQALRPQPATQADILITQSRILAQALKLAREGQISLPG